MEVHYHFIKEKVLEKDVELRQIKTEDQVADLFTKGLNIDKFEKFHYQLSMVERTRAGVEGECWNYNTRT